MSRLRPSTSEADPIEERVDRLGSTVHVDIVIPKTSTRAKLRICKRSEISAARAETRRYLEAEGFPVDATAVTSLGSGDEWQYELSVRIIATAVRDPKDPTRALASIEEWREECDDDQIAALMKMYDDHCEREDPIGQASLTEAELAQLVAAAKKKDADSLMAFGSRKLALFAITSANLPATSQTQMS